MLFYGIEYWENGIQKYDQKIAKYCVALNGFCETFDEEELVKKLRNINHQLIGRYLIL